MQAWLARLTLIAIIFFGLSAHAQDYVPGEVIVKMKGSTTPDVTRNFATRMRARRGLNVRNHWAALRMYHMALPEGQSVESAISDLQQEPEVEYVEPNYILSKAGTSGVQRMFSAQQVQQQNSAQSNQVLVTGNNIGLSQIYSQNKIYSGTTLNTRPIVAIIDTGLDTTHYVFQNTHAVWTNPGEIASNGIDDDNNGFIDDVHGWNFVSNNGAMLDDDGHGTHVAGIILSIDQNIFATTLQTSKIQIMPLKFLDSSGNGSTSNAIKAIYYAIQNGATVMNNSWGGSAYSSALNEAIAYSYNAGAAFVAAAGNGNAQGVGYDTDNSPMYPAGYDVPNVLSVAAITDSDTLASFSNFGTSSVQLGSPGVYILSTWPGNSFAELSGTSMATPFVTGTAIQMKVYSPDMLGYQIKSIIMSQTTPVSGLTNKVQTSGKLNTVNAINKAAVTTADTSQPVYSMSGRGLASTGGGAGCGMVHEMSGRGGNGPDQGMGSIAVTFVLVMAPLAYLMYRRVRNPANRRRFERFNIKSEVRINVGDKELIGSVSSISLGGARVDTNALLQDGGLVTLSIASPDGSEKVEVEGRVVWSEANKAYGVAFNDAPESALSRIANWTKALQRAS